MDPALLKIELSAFRKRWSGWFSLVHHGLLLVSFVGLFVLMFRGGAGWELYLLLLSVTVMVVWWGRKVLNKGRRLYVDYFVSRGISRDRALRYWEKENLD